MNRSYFSHPLVQRVQKYRKKILWCVGGLFVWQLLKLMMGLSFFLMLFSMVPFQSDNGVNLLLVGTDHTEGTRRSDAVAVLHINPNTQDIRVLSVPRDTRVHIDGVGASKLNHAFSHGGIKLLRSTVSQFLSIPIHHYVVVNSDGVTRLIDQIGGLDINVKKDMSYHDFAANLHINFKKGPRHFNGDDLIKYVRFRHDSKGDIGRVARQQQVSKLLFDKIFRFRTLVLSPKLLNTFFRSVDTDVSLLQMSRYLKVFLSKSEVLNVQFVTVPGSVRLIEGVSYWRPDIVHLDRLIDQTFVDYQVDVKPKNERTVMSKKQIARVTQQLNLDGAQQIAPSQKLRVEVLNGSGYGGVAGQTAQFLRLKRFLVTHVGNSSSFDYKDTLIVDWKGNLEKSLRLSKLLNIKPTNIVVYDRQDKPIDVTLVLGKDWTLGYLELLKQ
jgi:polyisoprenyl-teichoic acid--peptidoglycan teichoic acid transferase